MKCKSGFGYFHRYVAHIEMSWRGKNIAGMREITPCQRAAAILQAWKATSGIAHPSHSCLSNGASSCVLVKARPARRLGVAAI